MNVAFPYHLDGRHRSAESDDPAHLRALIEQVLFTTPGERVNRPDFGCGLAQLVFEPNSEALAATLQMLAQAALQQWLGDRLRVDEVRADSSDATLAVLVRYTLLGSGQSASAQFELKG
jgi:phage baseplate assembly protein W